MNTVSHQRYPVRPLRAAGASLAIVAMTIGCAGQPTIASPSTAATVAPSATASATPQRSATATSAPTASATPRAFGSLPGGSIPAGTYTLTAAAYDARLPRPLTFVVPAGWEKYEGGLPALLKNGAEPPNGMGVTFWTVDGVVADPCRPESGTVTPAVGPTIDDLATALTKVPRYTASEPEDVTIDEVSGFYLELTADDSAAGCTDNAFKLWTSSGREFGQAAGQRNLVWIFDLDGTRLVISAFHHGDVPESALAELRSVIESIEFADPS